MANPKDTKPQPPERGSDAGKTELVKQPERTPEQNPVADATTVSKPPEGTTLTTVIQQSSSEDKKRIRELEQRLLEQSEQFARSQRTTEEQIAELRKMMDGAPVRTPPPSARSGKVAVINLRRSTVTLHLPNGSALVLAPGANVVDGKAWAEAKNNEQVKRMLEAGNNPFSKDGLRDSGDGTTKSLDVTNALLLVQSITSLEDLEFSMSGERRSAVTKAAEGQAKRIRDTEERIRSGSR